MVRNVKVNHSTFFTGETGPGPGEGGGKSPAQACRQLRAEMGADAFSMAYGKNYNGRNAFGKCVSKMAGLKSDDARAAAVEDIEAAISSCLERTTSGHGKGKHHGKAKDHGKTLKLHGKGHGKGSKKGADKCLRHAV